MNKVYVYFINVLGTDTYKVGITNNLERRLKQIQTSNDKDVVIHYYIELPTRQTARKIESAIHSLLSVTKKRGEWYNIHPPQFKALEMNFDLINYGV